MKKIASLLLTATLGITLTACGSSSDSPSGTTPEANPGQNTAEPDSPQPDPDPIDPSDDNLWEIRPNIFFVNPDADLEIIQGLSHASGIDLILDQVYEVDDLLSTLDSGDSIFITIDEVRALDSAMGRECYIYTVAVGGSPANGSWGEGYTEKFRVSVDPERGTAAMFDSLGQDPSSGKTAAGLEDRNEFFMQAGGEVLTFSTWPSDAVYLEGAFEEGGAYWRHEMIDGMVSLRLDRGYPDGGVDEDLVATHFSFDSNNTPEVRLDGELTNKLGYSTFRVTFESGSNEDLRTHVAIYVAANDGILTAEFSVPADYFDDYDRQIGEWISNDLVLVNMG